MSRDSLYDGVSATSSKTVITTTDYKPRCPVCGGLLAIMATRPWEIDCRKCGEKFLSPRNGVPMPTPPAAEDRARRATQAKRSKPIPPPNL
ncbi:hypothetical protein UFOVP978_28 [uncultured Caudovirales phage]|uniref:Uncharacterized protein n=1 Tax=uncultured Caudovirales phage TaxID=2100421 RepID=A0A6J5PWX0_9CAUD|nr:hypothetical protein UFOVP978_28 [uncultured Caudovirales phage]